MALLAAIVGGAPKVAPLAHDGSIAYSVNSDAMGSLSETHLVTPDGKLDRVLGEGRCPVFSADGSVLARWIGPRPRGGTIPGTLMLTSLDGNAPRTLTGVEESSFDDELTLSPDGSQLAWLRPTGDAEDSPRELWVSPVSGGPGRRIGAVASTPDLLLHPSWSPDGRSIVISVHARSLYASYRTAIYLIDVERGDGRVLTTRPGPGGNFEVAWSPDGRSIAFVGVPDEALPPPPLTETTQAPPMDIFVVAADGSGERNVTNSPQDEYAPHWSPDGRRLAYINDYRTLQIVDADTWQPSGPVDATAMDGFTWSPDGSAILWYSIVVTELAPSSDGSSQQDVKTTLRSIPLDDSAPWSVVVPGSLNCDPSWQGVFDGSSASYGPTGAARSP